MSEQEVFNSLSNLEEYFFYYQHKNPRDLPFSTLVMLHENIKSVLKEWHKITGYKN